MKKNLSIILAALLLVSAVTGCAGQNRTPATQSPAADPPTAPTSSTAPSPNYSAAYEKLIAYKTEDYGQQSIADFNAALASTPDELTEFLAAEADVISTISPDDENYDFFATTMSFSAHELYCEHMGEEFTFFIDISKESRLCDYLDEYGEPVYEFTCIVELNVPYSIDTPKLVTVSERDKILLTFKKEMQNYLNGLSESEIVDGDPRKMLIDKSAELANSLSTENMKLLPCEITALDIIAEAGEAK